MHEIIEAVIGHLKVAVPIAAPAELQALRLCNTEHISGEQSLSLAIHPVDWIGDNIDSATGRPIVCTIGIFKLSLTMLHQLILPHCIPVTFDNCAID